MLPRDGEDGNLGAGAREWKDREEEKAWVKEGNPYLLIKAVNIERLPTRLKLAHSHGLCKQHGWVTHARIDENPAIRGHGLCFDKTCQWQPRLEMEQQTKNGSKL